MNALAQQQQALLGALLALPGSAQAAEALTGLKAQVLAPWTRGLAAMTPMSGGKMTSWLPFARAMFRKRLISRRNPSDVSNRRICCCAQATITLSVNGWPFSG